MRPRRRLTAPLRHRAPIARALRSASIGRRVTSRSRVPEGGRATTPVGLAVDLESRPGTLGRDGPASDTHDRVVEERSMDRSCSGGTRGLYFGSYIPEP